VRDAPLPAVDQFVPRFAGKVYPAIDVSASAELASMSNCPAPEGRKKISVPDPA
jgi:hypothetical protein